MLLASPQLISFRRSGLPLAVPAGAVIAWTGLIGAIPAGWLLCDGTAGTPDLSSRFIRATSGVIVLNATADGGLSGSTSTDGSHTGPASGSGSLTSYSGANYGNPLGHGAHSHPLGGTLDLPPHYSLAYIKASAATVLPAGAVVWSREATMPAGLEAYANLTGRFIKGVVDNTRAAAGVANRAYSLTTLSAGAHTHAPASAADGSSTYGYTGAASGAHDHGVLASGTIATKPLYRALMPLLVTIAGNTRSKLVLAYDGVLGALPAGWYQYAAMDGRLPIGVDAANGINLLDDGGSDMPTPLTGTAATANVNHSHETGSSGITDYGSYHAGYTWSHSHTYSAAIDPMVPYRALHFITRD